MINFRIKKSSWPTIPQHDPSFYKRFSNAWTNYQENEVESRVSVIIADPKQTKSVLRRVA